MRIAINGFGRIGRIFFRQVFGREEFEIVAINDLADVENLAYLLKYDSVYGRYDKEVGSKSNEFGGGSLIINGKVIQVFAQKEPEKLPWQDLGIDVVVEATGIFTTSADAKKHIDAGARRVVMTAPPKDEITLTSTPNLNFKLLAQNNISSNASCTTNAINPIVAIMLKTVGIKKAILNTIHGYTATQSLVDGIVKGQDFRRGRAAAQNIVPSTTGAAEATEKVLPEIHGKFNGIAIRVPVVSGSIANITFLAARPTTVKEINDIFKTEAQKPEWQGILKVTEEPVVSSDILGEPYGSIVDLTLTQVVDGDLVEVFSWYDNEWGYCAMLIKHLETPGTLTT